MKRFIHVNPAAPATDIALLFARAGIGILMLTHGLLKLAMLFSGAPVRFLPLFGLPSAFSLILAILAEVLCSVLVIMGFGTRLAVIPLIATMLVAALYVHAADPFRRQEPAVQYLLVYVILLFAGSGRYSVDYLIQRKAAPNNPNPYTNTPALTVSP